MSNPGWSCFGGSVRVMFRGGGPSHKWSAWLQWLMWFIGALGSTGRADNHSGCHKVCDITTEFTSMSYYKTYDVWISVVRKHNNAWLKMITLGPKYIKSKLSGRHSLFICIRLFFTRKNKKQQTHFLFLSLGSHLRCGKKQQFFFIRRIRNPYITFVMIKTSQLTTKATSQSS